MIAVDTKNNMTTLSKDSDKNSVSGIMNNGIAYLQ